MAHVGVCSQIAGELFSAALSGLVSSMQVRSKALVCVCDVIVRERECVRDESGRPRSVEVMRPELEVMGPELQVDEHVHPSPRSYIETLMIHKLSSMSLTTKDDLY